MARDHENFGGELSDRRMCAQHSGMDTKQTILIWLLGLLIVSMLGNAAVMQGVRDGVADLRVELAGIKADKNTSNEIHNRLSERLTTLERREEKR